MRWVAAFPAHHSQRTPPLSSPSFLLRFGWRRIASRSAGGEEASRAAKTLAQVVRMDIAGQEHVTREASHNIVYE